jgi:hypothetical protein
MRFTLRTAMGKQLFLDRVELDKIKSNKMIKQSLVIERETDLSPTVEIQIETSLK